MSDTEQAVDGRHRRSQKSRAKLADALLDLVAEGNVRPSSAQIAERAGVTPRTLFNQFGDLDSLLEAAGGRLVERILPLLPHAGTGTLTERTARFTRELADCLELLGPVRYAALVNLNTERRSGEPRLFAVAVRDLFVEGFPELASLPDDARRDALDELEAITDPLVWRVRRVDQGQDLPTAIATMRRTILAVIEHAARGGAGADSAPTGS